MGREHCFQWGIPQKNFQPIRANLAALFPLSGGGEKLAQEAEHFMLLAFELFAGSEGPSQMLSQGLGRTLGGEWRGGGGD